MTATGRRLRERRGGDEYNVPIPALLLDMFVDAFMAKADELLRYKGSRADVVSMFKMIAA